VSKLEKKKYTFDGRIARRIVEWIMKGKTVTEVSRMDGYPNPHIISYWGKDNSVFRKQLAAAKEVRAELLADEALETARALEHKSMAQVVKVKCDVLKWRAERDSPAQFAPRKVIEGSEDKPIRIVVETGIRRELDDAKKVIDVESETDE